MRNMQVTIVDSLGMARTVTTSSFGHYRIDGLTNGGEYTIGVVSRRYRFESRLVRMEASLSAIDFMGSE
jgi:hypothetical protein